MLTEGTTSMPRRRMIPQRTFFTTNLNAHKESLRKTTRETTSRTEWVCELGSSHNEWTSVYSFSESWLYHLGNETFRIQVQSFLPHSTPLMTNPTYQSDLLPEAIHRSSKLSQSNKTKNSRANHCPQPAA